MVSMPETAIHKNGRPIPPHDDVRFARHALHVKAIAVAMLPQPLPDFQLGLGAFAVDARHHIVALCGCEAVGDSSIMIVILAKKRLYPFRPKQFEEI